MSWLGSTVLGRLVFKLVALLVACALWVYVDHVVMETKTVTVRASVAYGDGRPAAIPESRWPVVKITVRGPTDKLDCVTLQNVFCTARVPDDYRGGRIEVAFDQTAVRLPAIPGLLFVSARPSHAVLGVESEPVETVP